jgi:hypothetical protein
MISGAPQGEGLQTWHIEAWRPVVPEGRIGVTMKYLDRLRRQPDILPQDEGGAYEAIVLTGQELGFYDHVMPPEKGVADLNRELGAALISGGIGQERLTVNYNDYLTVTGARGETHVGLVAGKTDQATVQLRQEALQILREAIEVVTGDVSALSQEALASLGVDAFAQVGNVPLVAIKGDVRGRAFADHIQGQLELARPTGGIRLMLDSVVAQFFPASNPPYPDRTTQ